MKLEEDEGDRILKERQESAAQEHKNPTETQLKTFVSCSFLWSIISNMFRWGSCCPRSVCGTCGDLNVYSRHSAGERRRACSQGETRVMATRTRATTKIARQ